MIKQYIKIFFIAFPLFIAFDASWIGVIAGSFYRFYLGSLLLPQFNYYAALLFYVLYAAGVMYFAILPALSEKAFTTAFIRGAVLGFIAYMTYDLSNLATLIGWPVMVVALDILWGTIMTACVASITYLLASKLYDVNTPSSAV